MSRLNADRLSVESSWTAHESPRGYNLMTDAVVEVETNHNDGVLFVQRHESATVCNTDRIRSHRRMREAELHYTCRREGWNQSETVEILRRTRPLTCPVTSKNTTKSHHFAAEDNTPQTVELTHTFCFVQFPSHSFILTPQRQSHNFMNFKRTQVFST